MKTLEQRMETELSTSLYLSHDFDEIEKEFIRLTKEWLIEHRKEIPFVFENNLKRRMIDELLKNIASNGQKETLEGK